MPVVSFDTETALSKPGLAIPPLACGSFAPQGKESYVLPKADTLAHIEELLRDTSVTFATHNGAYDFAVCCAERSHLIPLVFKAYEDSRVRDTDMRERLLAIAKGEFAEDRDVAYSLETLAKQRLKLTLDKHTWRHGYGKLISVPFDQWPQGAKDYARQDAEATLGVYLSQAAEADDYRTVHPDHAVWHEPHAVRKAWAMMLMRAHGVRVDMPRVKKLEQELLAKEKTYMTTLIAAGILEPNVKKNTVTAKRKKIQARVQAACLLRGVEALQTDKGNIKIDAEACAESGDPILETYAAYVGNDKVLGTFLRPLLESNGYPINAWWNPQLVSDRTSCSGPNFQNPPRAEGVRECIVPAPGYTFISVDFDTVELRALANHCVEQFGFSQMAERIRGGMDLHTELASRVLGITYEEAVKRKKEPVVKNARNLAKAINFGMGGGLGAPKFVSMSKKSYGLIFTEDEARAYKKLWLKTNPEMNKFFARIAGICKTVTGYGTVETPSSGMMRGACTYTAACNQMFQGPTAYGATRALFEVARECYVDCGTALYGCRIDLFIHDEIIISAPLDRVDAAGKRLAEVMVREMQAVLPHVPITASPTAMTRWSKAAEEVRNEKGELVVWEKQEVGYAA